VYFSRYHTKHCVLNVSAFQNNLQVIRFKIKLHVVTSHKIILLVFLSQKTKLHAITFQKVFVWVVMACSFVEHVPEKPASLVNISCTSFRLKDQASLVSETLVAFYLTRASNHKILALCSPCSRLSRASS
jgi:hypothetical protein